MKPPSPSAEPPSGSPSPSISVVIPTFGRDEVLCETVAHLLRCRRPEGGIEILVIDQTPSSGPLAHDEATAQTLRRWDADPVVPLRWVRRDRPSIPAAMNHGLLAARGDAVLFLDDDIVPDPDLIVAHVAAVESLPDHVAVVGQVLQPDESPQPRGDWSGQGGFFRDLDFPFWSTEPADVVNVMAGNLAVRRDAAIRAGGFDENFDGAAYRFETEFARRLGRLGPIRFEPSASLRHLRAGRGGTRSEGSHLTSASPRHGAGDYYFLLRSLDLDPAGGQRPAIWRRLLSRPLREVRTRFHLRHPWYIPIKLVGELRAIGHAVSMRRAGPRLIAVRSPRMLRSDGDGGEDGGTTPRGPNAIAHAAPPVGGQTA